MIASLDIKDVYYSVLVEERSQKFLKFLKRWKVYPFCILPRYQDIRKARKSKYR